MSLIVCDKLSHHSLKHYVALICTFLSKYVWLVDSYILNFFVENHWHRLPETWQKLFGNVEITELSDWLKSGRNFSHDVMPLSLLAFRKTTEVLSINRESVPDVNLIDKFLQKVTNSSDESLHSLSSQNIVAPQIWSSVQEELEFYKNDAKHLKTIFRRHIKPKKQHELNRIGQVIFRTLLATKSNKVVDIGSGQGHLSRILSFAYDLDVVSLETECSFVCGATTFDLQALRSMKKQFFKDDTSIDVGSKKVPAHVNYHLSADTVSQDFVRMINDSFKDSTRREVTNKNVGSQNDVDRRSTSVGLIGLHSCGSLAPTIIRLYAECANTVALVSLPCCYMKMYDNANAKIIGYPMSQCVKSLTNHQLGYEALELSCHSIDAYAGKLKFGEYEKLKVHCYRAMLEMLRSKYCPDCVGTRVNNVKYTPHMTFKQYVEKAVVNKDEFSDVDVQNDDFILPFLTRWKYVVVFYTLRLLIAPVIESLILLDRLLYLREYGFDGCLVPIFDSHLSPRNISLISVKFDKK